MNEELCTAILDTVVNFLDTSPSTVRKSIMFEDREGNNQIVEIDGKRFAISVVDLSYDDIPF